MQKMGRIGPYVLRSELGRGAMARVWRAWDPNLEREVAIKEPLFDPSLPEAVLSEMGRRFVAEGRAAARLSHPNVVAVYAADVWEGRPAIVMELVKGRTLSELLGRGPVPATQALTILDQLLDAVGYAHDRGIVHRDIKPDNVFVTHDGTVKLADFGIARVDAGAATRATVAGSVLGTPGYMSPEQARGEGVDARSDLFSVGVVAHEMLSGSNPFGSGEPTALLYRIVYEPAPELPASACAGLPADLRPAIMAALAKDPADRPQTAGAFKAMLHGEAASVAGTAVASTKRRHAPSHGGAGSWDAAKAPARGGGHGRGWLPYVIVGCCCIVALLVVLSSALVRNTAGSSSSKGVVTIAFDGGDANQGSMDTLTPESGASITVPACAYAKDGCEFVAWKDGEGTLWHPGDSIVADSNVTLTAVWDADACTVSFLGAGAEGAMAASEVNRGAEFTMPKCSFVWDGHSFECWVGEDGRTYEPGDTLVIDGDTALVARWVSVGETPEPAPPVMTSATPVASQPAPAPQASPAATFSRTWSGTYVGTSSYVGGDHRISRAVAFEFTTVEESGYLEGVCYVGADEVGPGATYGTCYVSGSVDWGTGSISLQGTGWIDQGGLGELREYSGTVDLASQTMAGMAWDVGTGQYETPWDVHAVGQISIWQNGSLTMVP